MSDSPSSHRALGDQRLLRSEKLKRRVDFVRCYKSGRRQHGPLLNLHYAPNDQCCPRIGITASRKVGPAVIRHRLKRRIREIYRQWDDRRFLAPIDLVFHLKPRAATSNFAALRSEIERLLRRLRRSRAGRSQPECS